MNKFISFSFWEINKWLCNLSVQLLIAFTHCKGCMILYYFYFCINKLGTCNYGNCLAAKLSVNLDA